MRGGPTSPRRLRLWIVALPIYFYLGAFWFTEVTSLGGNISLAYLIPTAFLTGIWFVALDRREFSRLLGRVGFEFGLLLVMVFLCLLSTVNSDEPFRAFRVLFPCVLPFMIFLQLCALRSLSPDAVERIPRIFLFSALICCSIPLFVSMVVPGLEGKIFSRNRLEGFLENPNQLSVILAALLPVVIAEVVVAKRWTRRLVMAFLMLVLIYTVLRTGSKTALGISLACCSLFYFLINFRSFSPLKKMALIGGMLFCSFIILTFGLRIAEAVDADLGMKLRLMVSGGVENYYSIESRQVLWDEAIQQGQEHWLVGSGAGQTILGNSHAHNLVLDYFRGIGVFGAAAVTLLCLVVISRAAVKAGSLLRRRVDARQKRIFACYMGAVVYVLCNQLSDCFGPSTVAVLWFLYLPAVMMDRPLFSQKPARSRPVGHPFLLNSFQKS